MKTGGVSKSRKPKRIWNKTPEIVENKIKEIRSDKTLYKSERTPVGIANKLEDHGIYMSSTGVWSVLKRNGENRRFVDNKKPFIIYPKSEKFLEVVCIDDIMLSNWKPRDLAIF